ncbi:response regulator transcription factor [Marinospirillum alkaliphilum]|uniref:DNA-binding response regulator, OmpR family, contains REC and winged-helix (WHTH) domain n=1 Tax=Marinospirillum alkaliphilum DSM 21637 TaxID=1122209 RepID=A0A1K1X4K0_9GAMM|nr:response regulator transcription factor [Marinospirillum alkaliphilum]SFX44076.1 DNA-binding response regulator, OmpR family, contains REC and winged-helix (wHTH) domain [Marinospirillum alkaliphilum DSM 21637]
MTQQVAIIEDDPDQAKLLASWLSSYGYSSSLYLSAELFLEAATSRTFDLLLVDWLLPGMSGLQLVKQLTSENQPPPIIFITGKSQDDDLAEALHSGADDFITKPLKRTVLIARIHAVMRRRGKETHNINPSTRLIMDALRSELTYQGQRVQLTSTEFQLLQLLLQSEDQLLTRPELADSLWGDESKATGGRALDVVISRLRKKLDQLDPSPGQISSHYGKGYLFSRSPAS